ncbi:Linear gramicidin dehydrogenase LgrE [Rubripirellula tenax]|uniref:Linear gramicidin dehydrogenase LgrE n=1 Tax=Rubripirellula tenax TaxID=2528015 RepID=A0A5C6EMJ8_9BACT|nr:alpha/beta fold hydrolase [Rubripirellula tenax]TWU50973.1 Linear gramicidin dehydrogenase LgrE [Rubripirellula tenax]
MNTYDFDSSVWLDPIQYRKGTPVLVGFPYSGSGTAAFSVWRSLVPNDFSLIAVRLPGRESRLDEELRTDIRSIAVDVAAELRQLNAPIIPFGISAGALLGYQVARELAPTDTELPLVVVLSEGGPPRTGERPSNGYIHEMSDDEFLEVLDKGYHAIPPAIAENKELLDLMLPVMRADAALLETYAMDTDPPLKCGVLALLGTEDPVVTLRSSTSWKAVANDLRVRSFPGGHFFFRDQPAAVMAAIVERARKCVGQPCG